MYNVSLHKPPAYTSYPYLSIGTEHIDDLLADLDQALAGI